MPLKIEILFRLPDAFLHKTEIISVQRIFQSQPDGTNRAADTVEGCTPWTPRQKSRQNKPLEKLTKSKKKASGHQFCDNMRPIFRLSENLYCFCLVKDRKSIKAQESPTHHH